MVSGTAEDGDGSGPVRVEVAETSVEDLVTAVAARVTAVGFLFFACANIFWGIFIPPPPPALFFLL